MSNDFSQIQAALASIPDISIDPNTGATIGATGKTLGEKYQMEDKVSPEISEKIRANAVLNENSKKESLSQVDAYKEMIGVPTSTQIKEHHQQMVDAQEEAMKKVQLEQQHIMLQAKSAKTSESILEAHFQGLVVEENSQLNEQILQVPSEDPMMDIYVNSIYKKLKWSK